MELETRPNTLPFDTVDYRSGDGLSLVYRDYLHVQANDESCLTVVCLPGMTRNAKDFATLAEALAGHYRVLCPDLRGRGESDYAKDPASYVTSVYLNDLSMLLEHAGATKVVLIGTSFGGALALRLAVAVGSVVKGIILNDIGPGSPGAAPKNICAFLRERVSINTWQDAADLCQRRHSGTYPDWIPEQWMTMAHNLFRQESNGNIVPDFDADMAKPYETGQVNDNSDLWDVYKACGDQPLLIVRGALSQNLTSELCETMLKANPMASAVTVPNVGHPPILAEPIALSAVQNFIKNVQ